MKKIKRVAVLCAVTGLLLCGCQEAVQDEPTPNADPITQQQLAESATKIAYYEELVVAMQGQILDLKSALYASRAEYDALYAIYQASQTTPDTPTAGNSALSVPYRYTKGADSVTILGYTGSDTVIRVPEQIEGLPVRAIGDRAFSYLTSVTEIHLPSGVQSVGWFAFSGCVALEKVTLPTSVSTISYGAFENCSSALTVYAAQNSYSWQYAQSYGIRTAT